jgi:hypothetical protein
MNDRMEFDHPVRVEADGSVTESVPGVYAPESVIDTDEDGQILADDEAAWLDSLRRQGWEPLNGYSGQYLYSGPIMHPSEYIGGRLEDDILAEPGVYVVVSVECLGPDEDSDPEEPAGWAVLRQIPASETDDIADAAQLSRIESSACDH